MRKIVQLPPRVAERIAAGEVVERPASVVKELVENAVDAGATDIAIGLRKGGKDLIRVQDDGAGIPADELPLAVARYATSKISGIEDLWRVTTLGFRGEALASIGQVAELAITSSTGGGEGAAITVKGGVASGVRPAACPRGTIVEVRDLFFTVPARRKFLKQDAAEFGRAAEWVTRIALSTPRAGFTLEHDGKLVWRIAPDATLAERMSMLFGPEAGAKLLTVEGGGAIEVRGAVARPEVWRRDRRAINFFVNGRHVRDPMLNQALEEGFRGCMVPGRFPVAVLGVLIDPERIDVNVHPAKAEIRFANGSEVFQAVVRAVRAALARLGPRAIEAAVPRADAAALPMAPARAGRAEPSPRSAAAPDGLPARTAPFRDAADFAPRSGPVPFAPPAPPAAEAPAAPARVLQVARMYLVREGTEGIEIVDQHALHEKMLFLAIRARLAEGPLPAQELFFPVPVRLRPEEAAEVEERRDALETCGLRVEIIGPDTAMLRSVPAFGETGDPERLLREVLEDLRAGGGGAAEAMAARLACHLAVRAGRTLSAGEAGDLLGRADGMEEVDTCPHGRPTKLVLGFAELRKHFDRP